MTLIAFATYGDHAEFITDTASYTLYVESMGKTTKHLTLNHLDAAVLTQGNSRFGNHVKSGALQASGQVASFDELVKRSGEWVPGIWQAELDEGRDPSESSAFLIGWSDDRLEFAAFGLNSNDAFTPRRISAAFITPCPWRYRPSRFELAHAREWFGDDPKRNDFIEGWAAKPVLQRPRSIDEWRDLAVTARDQRALVGGNFLRVLVAGQIHHTRLDRGAVTSQKIHEFNDSGEEFLQLVSFTHHPQAQTMPCWCDSGERFIDCHLREDMDNPCGCGSKKTFRGCCAVQAPAVAPV